MKHIIILGDGMSDHPIAKFNGKTPLEAADTPRWIGLHVRVVPDY